MSLLRLCGLVVFAYGPSVALFLTVVAPRSQLVLLTVTSAFTELVALLLVGLLWWLLPEFQQSDWLTVVVGVLIQEVARLLYLVGYVRGDRRIKGMVAHSPLTDFSSMIAAGLGFGLMYTLIMYGGVLQASLLPGDYFLDQCPLLSGFVVTALLALLFQMLNSALTVLVLDALRRHEARRREALPRFVMVLLAHMGASLASLANSSSLGCNVGMPAATVVVLFSVAEALRTVSQPSYGGAL
jgi:anterior pharynx defective protein 1